MRIAFVGLIVCFLAVCQPQVEAQFGGPFAYGPQQVYQQQPQFYGGGGGFGRNPRQGSVSRANSNAYERQVDLGDLEYTRGVSNSRAVTRSRGGTTVADTNALTRDVNVGGLDIGNTLSRTRTNTGTGGISDQFRVGNLGVGASLSPQNLRNGFGLQRGADGDLRLGLGLLDFDLTNNAKQPTSLTQAQVNAQGQGARVRSNSNTQSNTQNFGGIGVTDTRSQSNAVGRTRFGQTSANTAGFGGNANTYGNGFGFLRTRRAPSVTQYQRPVQYQAVRQLSRPKRRAQFIPFGYPELAQPLPFERPRRQFGFQRPGGFGGFGGGGFGGGGFGGGGYPGEFGFGGYEQQPQRPNKHRNQHRRPEAQQATGGAHANGGPDSKQQAATNTHSKNEHNQNGDFVDNGSSSISSNIANDGSRGQVSSANTNQQSSHTAAGIRDSNAAQSQSLNFAPGQQQATSSNAQTLHTQQGNDDRYQSNSGSTSTNNNQFGTATNTANTNSEVYRDGNAQGSKTNANSQSLFQGANGGNAAANTNAKTDTERGADGSVTNSASASSTANSENGGDANAFSSAGSIAGGPGGDQSFANGNANAGGFPGFGVDPNGGGANANANAFGNFGPFGFFRRR